MKNNAVSMIAKQVCAFGALTFVLVTGCAAEPDEARIEHQVGLRAASHTTVSELGVVTWKVMASEEGIRVLGSDADTLTKVETIVHPIAEDLVQIDVVSPVAGSVWLHLGGESEGATSDYLQHLAAALYADLGGQSKTVLDAPIGESGDIGTAALALPLAGEGHIAMPWSFFGYTVDETVGYSNCQGERDSHRAYPSSTATCRVKMWTTQTPDDCRIELHRSIGGWTSDTCNWFVYKK
jgi:hypothetical protein